MALNLFKFINNSNPPSSVSWGMTKICHWTNQRGNGPLATEQGHPSFIFIHSTCCQPAFPQSPSNLNHQAQNSHGPLFIAFVSTTTQGGICGGGQWYKFAFGHPSYSIMKLHRYGCVGGGLLPTSPPISTKCLLCLSRNSHSHQFNFQPTPIFHFLFIPFYDIPLVKKFIKKN
jgi:hypothetical protein